jgi:hypothetical protein
VTQTDRFWFLTQINAVCFSLDTDLHRLTLFLVLIFCQRLWVLTFCFIITYDKNHKQNGQFELSEYNVRLSCLLRRILLVKPPEMQIIGLKNAVEVLFFTDLHHHRRHNFAKILRVSGGKSCDVRVVLAGS